MYNVYSIIYTIMLYYIYLVGVLIILISAAHINQAVILDSDCCDVCTIPEDALVRKLQEWKKNLPEVPDLFSGLPFKLHYIGKVDA